MMWPDRGKWIVLDQSVNKTSIFTVSNQSDILGKQSSLVIKCAVNEQDVSYFQFNTCVSMIKRQIGLNAPLVFTPYQLYKRLCK